jgi:hypothetical protein
MVVTRAQEPTIPFTVRYDAEAETDMGPGLIMPAAVCDACNQPVTDAKRAVYLNHRDDAVADRDVPVLIAHEGDCHNRLEARMSGGGRTPGWNRLHHYLLQLAYNSGAITEEQARRLLNK